MTEAQTITQPENLAAISQDAEALGHGDAGKGAGTEGSVNLNAAGVHADSRNALPVNPQSEIPNPQLYDSEAIQRFEFTIAENGKKYQTAHIFNPLPDERYLQFLQQIKVKAKGENIESDATNASQALWDDLIKEVENVDFGGEPDWKPMVSVFNEKIPSLNNYLAVAIIDDEAEEGPAAARRIVKANKEPLSQTVVTEAFFNGEPVRQSHVLQPLSVALATRYSKLQEKTFNVKQVPGVKDIKIITYRPQDAEKARLYDEMALSQTGFSGGIPLRFKVKVVDYIFAPTLEAAKK